MTIDIKTFRYDETAYRIATDRHSGILDGTGSTIIPGRWHSAACRMIYCAQYYSTALLEKLVHSNGKMPLNQQWIEITIPAGIIYQKVTADNFNGWELKELSQPFGDMWTRERRLCILIVPSIVAREDNNILINQEHPDFDKIKIKCKNKVVWDKRLFKVRLRNENSEP